MRRTGGWPRKKRLQAKTELRSRSELRNTKPLERGELVAKPKKRKPGEAAAEKIARKLVRARSGGVCEVCRRERATNFQHRLAEGHGGQYTACNGLDVCGMGNASGCHGRIHQYPLIAYERGWSVRSGHDPAVQPVWLAGHGWSLLRADGSISPYKREAA